MGGSSLPYVGARAFRKRERKVPMSEEVLFRRGTILVRRQRLSPGETLPWHRDPISQSLGGPLR
jgi:hypothetical protein